MIKYLKQLIEPMTLKNDNIEVKGNPDHKIQVRIISHVREIIESGPSLKY